jgi:hypothetical protein
VTTASSILDTSRVNFDTGGDRAPTPESTRNPLELAVHSCARLIKERAHERDEARLERDLARRERDTVKQMLSLALTQLHTAITTNRLLEARARRLLDAQPRGYLNDEQRGYAP